MSYLGALVVSFNQCAHVTIRASVKERKSSPPIEAVQRASSPLSLLSSPIPKQIVRIVTSLSPTYIHCSFLSSASPVSAYAAFRATVRA